MTDYLGPLTFGANSASDTYCLTKWDSDGGAASLEVIVKGTSSDTLATYMEALIAQLRIGNTYAHFQPGNTYPTVYTVVGVSAFKLDALESWHAFWQRVSFTLNLAGMPAGALTTLYSAQHVDTPASVALSALLGTNPMALDVTIDDDSGNDMHSVWCALAPTALSDAKWYVLASALTWTTMSSGTGATYWGNSNRYTVSASYQTAPLDTSQYPAGKYRLLARVCQEAGTGYVKDSQNDVAVAITRTTPHLLVVGDLDLPVSNTAPGTASNLTISVKSDGTNDCLVNALVLLPLEYGYFAWHPNTAGMEAVEIDQLDVGPSGIFMDQACDTTHFSGGILAPRILAAHVGTLIPVASPTGSDWPASWGKTDAACTADTNRFKFVGASKYGWYAATNLATPLVVAGAWYELAFTRDVDSWAAGAATAEVVWEDVDGNIVRTDLLSTTSANDASPLAVTVHAQSPAHAARALVRVGTSGTGDMTVYFSAVVFRRCPLRLIVVAEDAAGALSSYLHPVHLTVKYTPRYEVAR